MNWWWLLGFASPVVTGEESYPSCDPAAREVCKMRAERIVEPRVESSTVTREEEGFDNC